MCARQVKIASSSWDGYILHKWPCSVSQIYCLPLQPSLAEVAKRDDFGQFSIIPPDFIRKHGGNFTGGAAGQGS